MPYTMEHKAETRARIVEAARVLFNRHGFEKVTIDMVMESIGLTRGGFYNHFENKEALYSEAVKSFLMGRGAEWRADAGIDLTKLHPDMARQMIESYLSNEHLDRLDDQCPMIALPSDVARAGNEVRASYHELLVAMVWLFENSLADSTNEARTKALEITALCIGGMVIARALPKSSLVSEIRAAAHLAAVAATEAD